MPSTYTPIATTTFTSAASSYTFSNIPTTYTDLILVFADVTLSGSGAATIDLQVGNGSIDTNSNYSFTNMGARAFSSTPFIASLQTTTVFRSNWYTAITPTQAGMGIIHFMSYSNTSIFKSMLSDSRIQPGDSTYSGTETIASLWRSTSAINTIKIAPNTGSFAAGSTFTLYGIKAA